MTTREAAIVSAYTGYLVGPFATMQGYVEEKLGRIVWTHEFADKETVERIKVASKDDFCALAVLEPDLELQLSDAPVLARPFED